MDDYSIASLNDSKNEWCSRLINILLPHVLHGIQSLFNEACKMCVESNESSKYLMTFQTLLTRIPKWNNTIISEETKRIETSSQCNYLADLISCVHIIQLKSLTCIRVGQKQKQIDIDVPSKDLFIHNVYINTARKFYTCVYLFEENIPPLQKQKNNREIEIIVKEGIMATIRDTMPVEQILQAYINETEEEHDEIEEIFTNNYQRNPINIHENTNEKSSIDVTDLNEDSIKENLNMSLSEDANIGSYDPKKLLDNINSDNSISPFVGSVDESENIIDYNKNSVSEIKSLPEVNSQVEDKVNTLINKDTTPVVEDKSVVETSSIVDEVIKPVTESVTVPITETVSVPVIESQENKSTLDHDVSKFQEIALDDNKNTISFSDNDNAISTNGEASIINAPKNIERLEQISIDSFEKRKNEYEDEDDEYEKITIGQPIKLDNIGMNNLNVEVLA